MNLILRDGGLFAPKGKPYALQLRDHGPAETTYYTITYVTLDIAKMIIEAGPASWLHGEPRGDIFEETK